MKTSSQDSSYILMAPGPVNLHPEVRKILALPMIHHRTPEFDRILARVLLNIKKIFSTQEEVFLLSSTGSGGMETLLVNTLCPGDTVLAVISGKFGERWAQMAETFGAKVIPLHVPWGQSVDPDDVARMLQQHPEIRIVLCQACETSTATSHPVQKLGQIIANLPNTLFFVDAITALGAYELPMDAWHIDGLVGGSQKAFMLPTGMSLIAFSKKAWAFVEKGTLPRFYFDVRKERKANASGETYFSSNVALIRALDWVLTDIERQGLANHYQTIQRRAHFIRTFAVRLGLSLYSQSPADSVTALLMPTSVDGQKVRSLLEENHRITIMGGQDQAKGRIIRIGHMGYIQDVEQLRVLECLGAVLHSLDPQAFPENNVQAVVAEARAFLGIA